MFIIPWSERIGRLYRRPSVDKRGEEIELIRCYRGEIYARARFVRASTRYRLTSTCTLLAGWPVACISFRSSVSLILQSANRLVPTNSKLIDLWNLAQRSSVTRWNVNRRDKRWLYHGNNGRFADVSFAEPRSLMTDIEVGTFDEKILFTSIREICSFDRAACSWCVELGEKQKLIERQMREMK